MHQFEVAVPVSYRTVHTVVSLKFVLMYNCTNFVNALHYLDKLSFFHDLQNISVDYGKNQALHTVYMIGKE